MGPETITFTWGQLSTLVLQSCALVSAVAGVVKIIVALIAKAKAPNEIQDKRITTLEEEMRDVHKRREEGDTHFSVTDEGNRITQEALLALMSHAINGNDVDKLREAKSKLEAYLIKK
jgi:hypothetical protein